MRRIEEMYNECALDEGDLWGSAVGALFDICDALYRMDEEIPADWQYSPGMGAGEPLSFEHSGAFAWELLGEDPRDLRAFGRELHYLASVYDNAGLSR